MVCCTRSSAFGFETTVHPASIGDTAKALDLLEALHEKYQGVRPDWIESRTQPASYVRFAHLSDRCIEAALHKQLAESLVTDVPRLSVSSLDATNSTPCAFGIDR